jgi:hypothetical protein
MVSTAPSFLISLSVRIIMIGPSIGWAPELCCPAAGGSWLAGVGSWLAGKRASKGLLHWEWSAGTPESTRCSGTIKSVVHLSLLLTLLWSENDWQQSWELLGYRLPLQILSRLLGRRNISSQLPGIACHFSVYQVPSQFTESSTVQTPPQGKAGENSRLGGLLCKSSR